MLRGDFAAAWKVSDRILQQRVESRQDCSDWPRHLQYVWRGTPLDGRQVLVRCYHGLGDTIQFVRLLRMLRPRVCGLTLWVQPSLIELLRSVEGIDRLLQLHDGAPNISYDVDVELMELPHALRLTPETIPSQVPYIYVSPLGTHVRSGDRLQVGLAWQSGDWKTERSIPDVLVARFGSVENVQWHSLQYETEVVPLQATRMVRESIYETARRMLTLDLVISVDTLTAHLAGALGLPVWTLLGDDCDWRWMSHGERSLWYPTMRLFRQPRAGDWRSVIEAVSAELESKVLTRAHDTRSVGCTAS